MTALRIKEENVDRETYIWSLDSSGLSGCDWRIGQTKVVGDMVRDVGDIFSLKLTSLDSHRWSS